MGTHPIFESDLDCLTENFQLKMFEDIMKNVEKELQGQYHKVKEIENQRGMLTKRVGQIEAQIAECKVVLMELGLADENAKCFKTLGPVLVDQTLAEAKETVSNRQSIMEKETERMKKGVVELSNMFKKENEALQELNMKAKQIKEALETA